jgi:hypothetical protein
MRPFHHALLVAAAALATPLGAQRSPAACACLAVQDTLALGVPVRLRVRRVDDSPFVPDGPPVRIGTFAGWRVDTLLVRFRPHGAPTAVPPHVLRSLERGTGRRPGFGGAIVGSFMGFASGAALGALLGTLAPSGSEELLTNEAAGALLGAAAGTLIGTAIGFQRGSQRWVRVPLR